MYAERFSIDHPAGIHGLPITHLGQLGLKVDDLDLHPRNGNELLSRYEFQPEKQIILSSDSGDPAVDKAKVAYGKTTIQNGTGPYAHQAPVFPNSPQHLTGAFQALSSKGIYTPGEVVADDGGQQGMQATGAAGWKRLDTASDLGYQHPEHGKIFDQGGGLGSAKGSGRWWVEDPEGNHVGTHDTLAEAKAAAEAASKRRSGAWKTADQSLPGYDDWKADAPGAASCPHCGAGMNPGDPACQNCGYKAQPHHEPGESLGWDGVAEPEADWGINWEQHGAKTAAGQVMYHVASVYDRESIQQHGLDSSMGEGAWRDMVPEGEDAPYGNYLWASEWDAEHYGSSTSDTWAVDVTGLSLIPDPNEPGLAFYVEGVIPPQNLTLVKPAEDDDGLFTASTHDKTSMKLGDMSTGVMPQGMPMGGTCPNCGNPLGAIAQGQGICPSCKTMTSQQGGSTEQTPAGPNVMQTMPAPHQPPPGMNPRDPARLNIAHREEVSGDMIDYSKFHVADLAPTDNSVDAQPVPSEEPGTNDGPFNDTSDVSDLSTDQKGAFQEAVNMGIDLLNKAAQQGIPLDISAVTAQLSEQGFPNSQKAAAYALQQPTDQTGMRTYPANNDPVPDPSGVGQGDMGSAVGGGMTNDQVVSPMEQPSNGAFAHVKLPNGKVGHVTDTYEDMWGSGWVRVAAEDGSAHDVLAEQVEPVAAPASADPVNELQAFVDAWPVPQGTVSGVQDHLARIRTARQFISRQMHNPALSHNERVALDKIDAELQYANLATGQAVIERADHEQDYLNTLASATYSTDIADTESIGGVSVGAGLDLPEEVALVTPSALERVHEEHPEVLVDAMSSAVRGDLTAVTTRAIEHINSYTAGYPRDVRAEHRQRFVSAVQHAASAYPTASTTKTASAEPTDWDGPTEALFMPSLGSI